MSVSVKEKKRVGGWEIWNLDNQMRARKFKQSHMARVALQTITGKLVNLANEPELGQVCWQFVNLGNGPSTGHVGWQLSATKQGVQAKCQI